MEHMSFGYDEAGPGDVRGERSLAPRFSARLVEASTGAARPDDLEIVGVALGIALALASLVRRALGRSPGAVGVGRPAPLMALVPGALGELGIGALRFSLVLTRRIAAPLRSVAAPLASVASPLEPALRDVLTTLEASWRETRIGAEASAVAFTRTLEHDLVHTVLAPLDLTDIVRTRVDFDALVEEIDVQRIAARIDVDALITRLDLDALLDRIDIDGIAARVDLHALVARLDLAALTQEVVQEIDLPALVRESTGTLTTDAIEEVRFVSLDADRLIARVVDQVFRRRRRHLDAPGEPLSLTRQQGGN